MGGMMAVRHGKRIGFSGCASSLSWPFHRPARAARRVRKAEMDQAMERAREAKALREGVERKTAEKAAADGARERGKSVENKEMRVERCAEPNGAELLRSIEE